MVLVQNLVYMGNFIDDGADNLIRDLQQGNEKAFQVLFERFCPSLYVFAERLVKDREVVADIVQEAFLKYWIHRKDFDNFYQLKSYLYVVVRHTALNILRDNRRQRSMDVSLIAESDIIFQEQVMEEEAYRFFYHAIEQLPRQMRRVIEYSLRGLKNAEIAEEMNIGEESVHSYKKEAYKKLKDSLKDYYYLLCIVFHVLFE